MRSDRTRAICLMLSLVLLLIFCSVGHECHGEAMDEHCPVCLILSAWKLALPGLLALAGAVCLCFTALRIARQEADREEKATLVALKVKLSN